MKLFISSIGFSQGKEVGKWYWLKEYLFEELRDIELGTECWLEEVREIVFLYHMFTWKGVNNGVAQQYIRQERRVDDHGRSEFESTEANKLFPSIYLN